MTPAPPGNPLAETAEPAVVALAAAGDDLAFGELVRRRQGLVRGLIRRLCGDWALADDLAQEAFIQAWKKLPGLKAPGAFSSWLRRIAVNTFLQHIRRKNLTQARSDTLADKPAPAGANAAIQMDLQRALAQLKPEERLCVVLSYSEGLSHSEICSTTKLPLGTVKSHIARGGAKLRNYLSAYQAGEK